MNHEPLRPIRSFVLRQGRVSAAQARAHASLLPVWGIGYAPRRLDLEAAFGRRAPVILEIGFGMGETTAALAAANPDKDYLGIEVHTPGVGALLKRIAELGLTNVRVIQHDAVEVLEHMIGEGALAAIHILFPDPWPKKRHHKRRLVQPGFARLAASRLRPGGSLHLATDWAEYAEQMLAVLGAEPLLENGAAGYAPRPAWRPPTRFEQRGLRLGHPVRDLLFLRRALPEERAAADR
ncbi:MAG: tRNA (guanosine(46)-N7)-methyltransferase TrmB [Rhodocyclaceae bacterium]